jgi:manganese/zinc/iron transport system ATP- binding protein
MKMKSDLSLEVKGLSVHYGDIPVLWDLDFSVPRGQIVGILGPNGAGKTTLVRAVLGLLDDVQGQVKILHHHLDVVRKKIAYLPQKETVDWDFPISVHELVSMGRFPKNGLFKKMQVEDKLLVEKALDIVQLLPYADRHILQLSGGQQQRAFLARAIAQDAEIYFLDEPFRAVDLVSEQIIIDVLRKMRDDKKTIFIVHHDLATAGKYFDWAILLNMRLIASGPFAKVFNEKLLRQTYGKNFSLIEDLMRNSTYGHS